LPVELPKGVTVSVSGRTVQVKGPKATLSEKLPEGVEVEVKDGEVVFRRLSEQRKHRAFHGLARALVYNMVVGVSEGFVRELEIHGVGYRADTKDGKSLSFNLGHSHPVEMQLPEGVTAEVTNRGVRIKLTGIDKSVLGQVIADIRALRPPEPYKGKGIRFVGERIRRKVGKAGATA
jgi:large subunit ribosomal protein L6